MLQVMVTGEHWQTHLVQEYELDGVFPATMFFFLLCFERRSRLVTCPPPYEVLVHGCMDQGMIVLASN